MTEPDLLPIDFDLVTPWADDRRWQAMFGVQGPNPLASPLMHAVYAQAVAALVQETCEHVLPMLRADGGYIVAAPGAFVVVFADGDTYMVPGLSALLPPAPWVAPNETVH